jgi:TonB-dependent Receptor Plug Domain
VLKPHLCLTVLTLCLLLPGLMLAQAATVNVAGFVSDNKGQVVAGATVNGISAAGKLTTTTDAQGQFSLPVTEFPVTLTVSGRYMVSEDRVLAAASQRENITLTVRYSIPPRQESLVITATALNPMIDQRNEAVYRNTLFYRDDQVFDTLAAGINAGQHEGGGKSLEIRRFGFNLDHGGVNGGLKVLVNDVQQNQGTQGHGQGYLGALKTLIPELVDDVDILNGPFSAEYGDFSGLGVVHIRLKETLPDTLMLRFQGGPFNAFRGLAAYSPRAQKCRRVHRL